MYSMLEPISSVMSVSDSDIGHAIVTQHSMKLSNDTPTYQRPRRYLPPITDEIERQRQELYSLRHY